MATKQPFGQLRNQNGRDWGNYNSLADLPNASAWVGALTVSLEEGDTAYVSGVGRVYCQSAGTPGSLNAVWVPTSASANPVVSVEIDFGPFPVREKSFQINDIFVTPTSRVVAWESAETATGRVGVDQEWDQLLLAARPGPGYFFLYASAVPGPVVGSRVIYYQRG
jgi:hypothetical protein